MGRKKHEADTMREEKVRNGSNSDTSKKTILFGGHPNWRKRFALNNPQIKMMNLTKLLKLDSVIRNADRLFINTNHISHKQYYAVMNIARKANVPIMYVR